MKNLIDKQYLRGDIFGGITAGIVALPLALAFGIQSGMGAIAGLYGAIVLGILAAIFGGTKTQISGPTGPMTVVSTIVVAAAIDITGSLEAGMGVIIFTFLVAGLIQVIFGLMGLGKYIKYIPYPVLSGFMTGIGVIIFLFQVYPLLGHSSAKNTVDIFLDISRPFADINMSAFGLGLLTIAIIYILPRFTKAVPSALVALIISTIVAVVFNMDVPNIGDIPSGFPSLKINELFNVDPSMYWIILEYGAMLAALGAIDSLLTSVIADNITKTKHKSNRELIGQGIGNMASSLIGGLPGAGATMRTVVNVNAGGMTRLSGVIHGVLLLLILAGAGKYAAYIPLSVLAGILMTVGIGIVDYKALRHLNRIPRTDAIMLLIVLLITVFGNLLHAVGVGVVLACVLFMKQASDLAESETSVTALGDYDGSDNLWEDESEVYHDYKGKIYIKHLFGPMFFGFTASFHKMIENLSDDVKILIIRMDRVPTIDQSGLYAMEDAIMDLQNRDVVVLLTGIQAQPHDLFEKIDIIPALIPELHIFKNFAECEVWIRENLNLENGDAFQRIIDELHEVKQAKVAYRL